MDLQLVKSWSSNSVLFILCQLAPRSAFIYVQAIQNDIRAVGPSLRLSGLLPVPQWRPEMVSITCDLHQRRQSHLDFHLDLESITENKAWLWEPHTLSDHQNCRCTLPSSWKKVTIRLFYPSSRIWGNESILPSAFMWWWLSCMWMIKLESQ